MTGNPVLERKIDELAHAAIAAGVTNDDSEKGADSSLAWWIRSNVEYREGTEFFIWFLTSYRMWELQGGRERLQRYSSEVPA